MSNTVNIYHNGFIPEENASVTVNNETFSFVDFSNNLVNSIKNIIKPRSINVIDVSFKNDFYEKNDDIYDQFSNNVDDIEFYIDEWFESIKSLNMDYEPSTYSFTNDIIDEYIENEDEIEKLKTFTMKDIKEFYPQLYDELYNEIMENEYYFFDDDMLNDIFNIEYPDETFDGYEQLAYWTIYFSPNIIDVEKAFQCDLFPFIYKGDFYLALGGCGMDLSPKLDAYQALTSGTIPNDSKIFNDENYFQHVIGKHITEQVKEKIKMEDIKIEIIT